jgi:L-ribulokinase
MTVVAGVDFGTTSVRVSLVDSERRRLGAGVAEYPVLRDAHDPHFATQRPQDHKVALTRAFEAALRAAQIAGAAIQAVAIDTTGSTVIPLDECLQPLDDYYLWCDHRAWREAEEITARARENDLPALDWCGGTYSSEWGFAKVLHWLRTHPELRSGFHTAAEHCDLVTAQLCGIADAAEMPRSVCAMGHKWMWNRKLGGLPPEEFLGGVDPLLCGLRERLQGRYLTAGTVAGELCGEWAKRLGLSAGIPISAGALDAHWDAVGVGCRPGDVVNVVGTSTCIMALGDSARAIPGVSGVVEGSIYPNKVGIEAGLSAVGDLFDAIARRTGTTVATLSEKVQRYRAGQTGLLRFAWDNGDRSVLMNPQLTGISYGWRLNHTAEDELFAAIEGTAFHTRIILERLAEHGVRIERVIHAGGIPRRNEVLNRVYASVLGKPVLVPATDTTSLGSAIFAFLAARTFKSLEEAQAALSPSYRVIEPVTEDVQIYEELFGRFRELYFRLGELPQSSPQCQHRGGR